MSRPGRGPRDHAAVAVAMIAATRAVYAATEPLRAAILKYGSPSAPEVATAWEALGRSLDALESNLPDEDAMAGGERVRELSLQFVAECRAARVAAAAGDEDGFADHWAKGARAWNDAAVEADRLVARGRDD